MNEFHVSSDGNTLTVLSMKSGYAVERPLTKVPPSVIREAHLKFSITPFKPGWSLEQKNLGMDSYIYQWYLYEKSVDIEQRRRQMELAVAGEVDHEFLLDDRPQENNEYNDFIKYYRFPDV